MSRRFGILALVGALFLVTGDARAQAPAGMEETVRPATTSIYGDTGLWFVPTGEVLRDGTWSASAYRLNWDVRQGFTDISHFEGTFAYGVKGRAEIFGAVRFITRIDRDTRPIFGFGGDRYGGVDNSYPFVREGWIGNEFGDAFLGAKFSLLSESRQHPVALALRGMVKLPTGSSDNGRGHRQDGHAVRLHRQQGNREHRRGLRQHRLPASRRSGRIRPVERHSVRHRRAVPDAQPAEVHDRVVRRDLQQRRRHADGVARACVDRRRRRQRSAGHVEPSAAVHAHVRRDLAGEQRVLRRRRS